MLELIMLLSLTLRKYSDLVVVGALLVINAMLSFSQERRAAGVVEKLRRRLQVSARVLRDSSWQVIPARELVPGEVLLLRPGDIVPADVKLLTGALRVDQSALTGESKDAEKAPGEMLSSGSVVRRGEGNGVVMLTGRRPTLVAPPSLCSMPAPSFTSKPWFQGRPLAIRHRGVSAGRGVRNVFVPWRAAPRWAISIWLDC
jgi:magnesium-transporting ATPase (P-type)